ncbi:RNA-splicing factor [Pseudocyphellaria aurata]|nr:RNA-splicing factor [Pseudocyphellaria aurata]
MDALPSDSMFSEPSSLFKKRTSKKTTIRKRPATPRSSASDSSDYSSSQEGQKRLKRQRKNGIVTAIASTRAAKHPPEDLETTKFTADRSGQIESTNDATKQSNWFDEKPNTVEIDALDAKALLGTTRARPDPAPVANGNDGTYKGNANYSTFITKNPNAPTRQVGPLKAPTNIRTITVTDFAPDVCKDYKQTGFCGFGDSCKFLHAREDYKQGWELDKDWEIGTKGKRVGGKKQSGPTAKDENDDDDDDAALEGIPFACIICKDPYTNPIITKCGHYFCEKCALQRYRKNPSCAACGAGTGGVFNMAKGLKKLLDKKRERARRRREKAIADGEEVDSDDEEDEGGGGGQRLDEGPGS